MGSKASEWEQKINDAKPKDPTPKKTWKVSGNAGDQYGGGKYKGKKTFAEPPPKQKSLADLP